MIQGQQAAQQPRETEQIVGNLTGIIQKGPDKWQAVVVPDGSQYGKNLWTKDQNLIATLSTMIGARLAFACNVSHWNMQDGTPVRSLWIDDAGNADAGSPAMQGPPYMQQAQQAQQNNLPTPQITAPPSQDTKEQRIHRQTATKVAAILLTNLPAEQRTFDTLLTLAERLVIYYNQGLPARTLDEEIQRAMPRSVDEVIAGGSGPVPQYTGDEDIPFMHHDRFDIDGDLRRA